MRRKFMAPVVLALAFVVGCASLEVNAYRTLSSVQVAVDTGMKIFAMQVVAGKVDAATVSKARDAYAGYQLAYQLAEAAITTWKSVGGPFPQEKIDAATLAANQLPNVAITIEVKR